MKAKTLHLAAITLAPLALLALAACSENQPGNQPAAIDVAVVTATETVEAVDPATRTVVLKTAEGVTNTYKLGPEVANFNQIKAGDKVKATVVEALAVFIRKAGVPSNAGVGSAIALAPKGAKPGAVMATTEELTAKIDSVDAAARTITLESLDGHPKTLKVSPKVDLAGLQKGDDVVVTSTVALALQVEKP
jgi:Cu/Ag efflux protein CusF